MTGGFDTGVVLEDGVAGVGVTGLIVEAGGTGVVGVAPAFPLAVPTALF